MSITFFSLIDLCSLSILRVQVEDYTMEYSSEKKTSCLMLGYAGLYNHHSNNNVYSRYGANQSIIFFAKKRIAPHEELFINYGKSWFEGRDFSDLTAVPVAKNKKNNGKGNGSTTEKTLDKCRGVGARNGKGGARNRKIVKK